MNLIFRKPPKYFCNDQPKKAVAASLQKQLGKPNRGKRERQASPEGLDDLARYLAYAG
jgi:hypothetical protein